MNQTDPVSPASEDEPGLDDPRLVQAVREYQAALERGERPSRRQFLSLYSDIASDLAECLDGLDLLRSVVPRLQGPEEWPVPTPGQPDGTLGDFRLIREIGRGGMGVVYEAVQISLGRRVALKILPLAGTLDPRQLQRFENEARAAAHLHHGNIVPVFAVGCERGVHYYAMQLIEGQTVARVIEHLRQTPQPAVAGAETAVGLASVTQQSVASREFFRNVAMLGVQAAEALEYAHQMGVVHRDVKPANLLLDGRGNLWVTDFGLARFQAAPGMTAPGDLVGTLRYMSPEQAAGQPVIDPRSDVYSLGATLYELLTQQSAFSGADRRECLRQVLDEEPPPLRRFNRAVPAELETIVLKAMAKRPEDRYSSAGELADDLRRFLDDQPVRARRPRLGERVAKWGRRHRRMVGAAVLGLVAAVLVLSVTTWRVSLAESRTRSANEQLRKEQREKEKALQQEVAQRARAERNYRQARKVVAFLTWLGVEELADKPGVDEVRQRLLGELLTYYQELIDQQGNDQAVTAELIEARLQVAGLLDELGRKSESLAAYEKAMHDSQQLPGGPHPFPPFGGPFGPSRSLTPLFLLGQAAVREELHLAPEQVKKLSALLDFRRWPRGEGPEMSEKAVVEVLNAEQIGRLQQITRQSRGPQALLDSESVEALELTAKQKEKIRSLLARPGGEPGRKGPGRKGRPPGPPGWGGWGPGGPGWKGHLPGMDRRQVHEQVLQVLTADQRTRWLALLGEPFRGELRFAPSPLRRPPPGR